MKCPKCEEGKVYTLNAADTENGTRRSKRCEHEFVTVEKIAPSESA
jgi:transcriptional regulator NrdR family protein